MTTRTVDFDHFGAKTQADQDHVTYGERVTFNRDCTITGLRVNFLTGTYGGEARLYRVSDGARLAAGPRLSGVTGWQTLDLPDTAVTAGVEYVIAVYDCNTNSYEVRDRSASHTHTVGELIVTVPTGQHYFNAGDGYPATAQGSGLEWNFGVVAVYNLAPNAPTLTFPATGQVIDRGATQRFSWNHSDPDGDGQSRYDLQYRPTAGGAWATVTGSTPTPFHDFAPLTFTVGDWEWQVRTYDSAGVVGPWSGSGFFTAATAPAGPTILDPINGQTVGSSTYLLSWSTAEQDAYQVRTVADDGLGAANTAVVYTDTGVVEAPTARQRQLDFPVNSRPEHVQVRTRSGGLWSPYTSVRVLVSYTPPAIPTLQLSPNPANGSIVVQPVLSAPLPGEPTVLSTRVWRRPFGELIGTRIGTDLPVGQLFTDRTPASGVEYEYLVQVVGDNGTVATSQWFADLDAGGIAGGYLAGYSGGY